MGRTIKQPYIPYEEIEDGFRVIDEDGEKAIEFEKGSVFTDEEFRATIIERYKNNLIMKVCQNCTRNCKQISVKGSGMKFTCKVRIKRNKK